MLVANERSATPVSYRTNTLVHVAGDHRFVEFLKVGVPMNLVVGTVARVAIHLRVRLTGRGRRAGPPP